MEAVVALETYLRSITFSGGQTVEVPRTGVLVLVGPNNVGKSAALREVNEHFSAQPRAADRP
jgi:ABC-type branched-subunit amino acid transport system ATPase component